MKKKLVKSQYGAWITVYEIVHESRVLWFKEDEIEAAAKRYAVSIEERDHGEESFVIRRD